MHLALYAALAAAVAVGVSFGVHDALAKGYLEDANAEALSAATLALGTPLLVALTPLAGGLYVRPLSALAFVVAGVLNFAVGRTLMYMATKLLSANGASVMTSTSALFSLVMAVALGEAIRASDVVGIVAIVLGVYLASDWTGRASPRGLLIGLLDGFAIAASVAIIKVGESLGGSPAAGVIIAYLSGLAALYRSWRGATSLVRSRPAAVSAMGVSAAAGQLLRYVALTALPVDVVTPLQNLRPLVAAAVLAIVGLGGSKRPRAKHWAAAALAFAGIALISGLVRF